jgi:Tfp pilus assembly pilus retraction ATPase PilT
MQAGGKYGMHTMEQSLAQLVRAGQITVAAATERASNAEELMDLNKKKIELQTKIERIEERKQA